MIEKGKAKLEVRSPELHRGELYSRLRVTLANGDIVFWLFDPKVPDAERLALSQARRWMKEHELEEI